MKALFSAAVISVLLVSGCRGQVRSIPAASDGLEHSNGAAHGLFTELLRAYVDSGRVDYENLCGDPRLDRYVAKLSATDPKELPGDDSRLAFWINAYNAFTLQVVCDNFPVKSINDLHFGGLIVGTALNKTIWDKEFIEIHGEKMSLNHIEHEIIRPRFGDPRIHFALVCAARSCPSLRPEAYEAARLDEQLDDQARLFLRDEDKNRFDVAEKTAHLSKVLDWYAEDFGETREKLLLSIAPYVLDRVGASIRDAPSAWKIEHIPYDWSLND